MLIDQISPILPLGSAPDPTLNVGTLTMIAGDLGLINFGFGATFVFGAVPTLGGNAATAEVVVPEPGTAALLSLGLAGLALVRRHVSSVAETAVVDRRPTGRTISTLGLRLRDGL